MIMPNLQNAKKALRQSITRAARNTLMTERISYMRRSFRKMLADNKLDDAKKLINDLTQALDKAVGKNILKKNTAARVKSRTMAHLNKALKK
jgi:small subunit ribosomal protein S20